MSASVHADIVRTRHRKPRHAATAMQLGIEVKENRAPASTSAERHVQSVPRFRLSVRILHRCGTDMRDDHALRALLRRRVDGRRRRLAVFFRQLRLRQRMEDRVALVPGPLEGDLHDNAAAMRLGIVVDRLLQRAGGLLIPRQHVIARLVGARQQQPEIDRCRCLRSCMSRSPSPPGRRCAAARGGSISVGRACRNSRRTAQR
jgi:hypothetical protein